MAHRQTAPSRLRHHHRHRPLRLIVAGLVALATTAACTPGEAEVQDGSAIAYEDGPITEAEYRTIVAAVRQCMMDLGYDVTEIEMRPDGVTYWFGIEGGTGEDLSSADDHEACAWEYNLPQAEVAYQEQNVLTGAEWEASFDDFIACLEDAGISGITPEDSLKTITVRVQEFENAGNNGSAATVCMNDYSPRIFGGEI